MSQSPLEGSTTRTPEAEDYVAGWAAINRLARQGDSWSGHEYNACFLNAGPVAGDEVPRMVDVSGAIGADFDDDARAAARIDIDFDGDEDLIVTARTSPRLRILSNRVADGAHHVGFRLAGTTVNRDGVGAVVRVTPEADGEPTGPTQRRTRKAGDGYLAQSSGWLRFGLGSAPRTPRVRVTVTWPGSTEPEDFGVVRAGSRYRLVEGSGRAVEAPPPSKVLHVAGPLPGDEIVAESRRIVLAAPRPVPGLDVSDASGARSKLFGATAEGALGTGRPTLVALWAPWCSPCLKELAALESRREELERAGIDLIALDAGVAGAGDAALDAPTALERVGWTGAAVRAEGDSVEILDTILEWLRDRPTRIPLPTSFLFQPDGRLAIVHVGAVDADALLADLRVLEVDPRRRAAAATPFPGTWRKRPDRIESGARDPLVSLLRARGLEGAARELELARVEARVTDEFQTHLRFARARAQQGTPESLEASLVHYRAAVELVPDSLEAQRGLAVALSTLGRLEEALPEWRAAVDLAPDDPELRASLGLALVARGDLDGADVELKNLRREPGERAKALAELLAQRIAQMEERLRKDAASKPKKGEDDRSEGVEEVRERDGR